MSIPKRTGSATAYWFGADNSDSVTESTGTIGTVTMSPKTVGALIKFSHLMSLQSTPDIEQLIRSDFVALIADAIDTAAINGSGSSNQPLGILNTSGIGSVAGGTNGAAPTLDNLLDLKQEVAVDNADVASCGFLTNTKVESVLGKLKDSQGQYLLSPYGAELGHSQIAGRRFEVSNNVPSNLTKGSGADLSAFIYGNFSDLLIGLFGTLEILVDPYTDFAKGTTGVRVLQSIDIAVRHAESFAAIQDAIAQPRSLLACVSAWPEGVVTPRAFSRKGCCDNNGQTDGIDGIPMKKILTAVLMSASLTSATARPGTTLTLSRSL